VIGSTPSLRARYTTRRARNNPGETVNDATVTPSDNGPYLVRGNVTILDAAGNQYEVNGTIALCRCGHSSTKPFCDGAHEKTNFAAVNRAATSSNRMRPQIVAGR
jgi:CDGSH-type Zn-finger protein